MYRMKFKNPDLPIHDLAEDGYLFQVTANDCERGRADDPTACALALSGQRAFRRLRSIHVLTTVAYLEFPDRIERVLNTAATSGMVREFDRTGEFEPGLYRFLPVPPGLTRERKKELNAKHGRPKTGKKPKAGNRMDKTAVIRPRGSDGER